MGEHEDLIEEYRQATKELRQLQSDMDSTDSINEKEEIQKKIQLKELHLSEIRKHLPDIS